MNINGFKDTIFVGDWSIEKNEDQVVLSRIVKINENYYRMQFGYTLSLLKGIEDPTDLDQLMIRVIEESQPKIRAFIEYHYENRKEEGIVSLKGDVENRTGAVAIRQFKRTQIEEEYTPLSDLQTLNHQAYKATDSLLQSIFDGCQEISQKLKFKRRELQDTKPLAQLLAQNALRIVQELKNLPVDEDGCAIYQGQRVKVPEEDIFGCRHWQFKLDGQDYKVNEFKEGAYNGVSTQDFLKRKELIYETAKQYGKVHNLGEKFNEILEILNQSYADSIKSHCNLGQYPISTIGHEGELSDFEKQYQKINKLATGTLGQFAKDAQYLIDEFTDDTFSMEDFDQCEKETILERDRPIILNTYFVENQQFLSLHVPEAKNITSKTTFDSKKTIPSSLRDREGLPNYITSYTGVIESDQVILVHEASRHSSYPPIAIKDPYERRKIALNNVKEAIRNTAFKKLQVNPKQGTRQRPVKVSMRTMMLFTPKMGDNMRNREKGIAGKWKGESEVQQMKECILALRTFKGRTFPIKMGEDEVWVTVDASMMNFGVNPQAAGEGVLGKIPSSTEEKDLNRRGFCEFTDEVEAFLHEDPLLSELLSKLLALEKGGAYEELEKESFRDIETRKEVLMSSYESLERAYQGDDKTEVERLQKMIRREEKSIDRIYKTLLHNKRNLYRKNQKIIKKQEQALLATLDTAIIDASQGARKEYLKVYRQVFVNLTASKKVFYSKEYRKKEHVMLFPKVYIETQSLMNNNPEFFCKSGEDRTGNIDDKVQERKVFYVLKGRSPELDNEEDQKFLAEVIAPAVHQYSASQNTTEENSNARGEQVQSAVNPELFIEPERQQATLAKRVITKAKKCKPSDVVQAFFDQFSLEDRVNKDGQSPV